jgi:hypothetical protein
VAIHAHAASARASAVFLRVRVPEVIGHTDAILLIKIFLLCKQE